MAIRIEDGGWVERSALQQEVRQAAISGDMLRVGELNALLECMDDEATDWVNVDENGLARRVLA